MRLSNDALPAFFLLLKCETVKIDLPAIGGCLSFLKISYETGNSRGCGGPATNFLILKYCPTQLGALDRSLENAKKESNFNAIYLLIISTDQEAAHAALIIHSGHLEVFQ